MRMLATLIVVTLALAACDLLAPAAADPSRPSLFPGTPPPRSQVPTRQAPAGQFPANQLDATQSLSPAATATPRSDLLQPYPGQRQVLGQQRLLLDQGIRQQETSRDALSLQLQQGAERDRLDALRLQQQIEQDRTRR